VAEIGDVPIGEKHATGCQRQITHQEGSAPHRSVKVSGCRFAISRKAGTTSAGKPGLPTFSTDSVVGGRHENPTGRLRASDRQRDFPARLELGDA
jgi:hypothetical protein